MAKPTPRCPRWLGRLVRRLFLRPHMTWYPTYAEQEIRDCPFCGASAQLGHDGDWYAVYCTRTSCEARGPLWGTRADAIELWNHRRDTDPPNNESRDGVPDSNPKT